MVDTKSTIANRKHTLLHYLTEVVEKEFPNISGFHNQMSHVDDGAKVAIPAIRSALITIRDNLKSLNSLLEDMAVDVTKKSTGDLNVAANSAAMNAKFSEVMSAFAKETQEIYDGLDSKFKDAEKDFKRAVTMYGEDPENVTPEEFLGIFAKFIHGYIAAKTENEVAIAKEIQEKKREGAKRDQDEAKKKKKDDLSASKEGGLDDLISSLKTGKAFGNNVDPAAGRVRRQINPAPRVATGSKGPEFFGNTNFQNEQGVAGRLRHDHHRTVSKPDPIIKPKQSSEVQQLLQKDAAKRVPNNNVSNFTPGRPGGDLAALLQKDMGRKASVRRENAPSKADPSKSSPPNGSPILHNKEKSAPKLDTVRSPASGKPESTLQKLKNAK